MKKCPIYGSQLLHHCFSNDKDVVDVKYDDPGAIGSERLLVAIQAEHSMKVLADAGIMVDKDDRLLMYGLLMNALMYSDDENIREIAEDQDLIDRGENTDAVL